MLLGGQGEKKMLLEEKNEFRFFLSKIVSNKSLYVRPIRASVWGDTRKKKISSFLNVLVLGTGNSFLKSQ